MTRQDNTNLMSRQQARELAQRAVKANAPLSWFEPLYQLAVDNPALIPWADLTANPNLTEWLDRESVEGGSRSALVVGCGLGDDAEALARYGFAVTAFDIAPTCIAWCQRRFPASSVNYLVADVFQLPASWNQAFDFVFEAYTLQVLPEALRNNAMHAMGHCVRPGGRLLIVTRGRDAAEDSGEMPWPLQREELDRLGPDFREVRFEDYLDNESPPVRRFRVEFLRAR